MDLLEKNLQALAGRNPGLAGLIRDAGSAGIETAVSRDGDPVPSVERNGKKIFLHSKFDPRKEAERFIGEVKVDAFDLFLVFGFGFGYHLEELLGKMGEDAVCLAVEKDAGLLRAALSCRDLSAMLGDARFILLVNPDEDTFADALKGKSSRTVNFITHRGSHQLDGDYYRNGLELARSFLSTKNVNIATLAKFEKIWSANIARNILRVVDLPGANIFFDRFTGVPAIVVAAGPSLAMSIPLLKELEDRCLLVAVDTSYGVLRRHGIDPHFCLTVDPQLLNARYFEGTAASRAVLVADPVAHPAVFRLFKGRAVTTGFSFDLMKWIEGICGEKGVLANGGSVSTNAYDFARRLGASPVVMVGQDLSFTGGYAHVRGSYLDGEIHLRTSRILREEMFNRTQLTALPKILVPGIAGTKVHTNQKMMIFLSWFEKRRDPNLVNATFDGARIPGVEHRQLGEMDFGGAKNIRGAVDTVLRDHERRETKAARKKLAATLQSMVAEIDALLPELGRAVALSNDLVRVIGNRANEGNRLPGILKKLGTIDGVVQSKIAIKDIISFSMQRVIHTITEGYEIDEGDASMSEDELTAKRSLYLYRGLLESTVSTRTAFGKMLRLLDSPL